MVVHGRMHSHVWESDAGPRTDLVIDAISLGHDLTRGIARFTRATGDAALGDAGGAATEIVAAEDGADGESDVEPQDDAITVDTDEDAELARAVA